MIDKDLDTKIECIKHNGQRQILKMEVVNWSLWLGIVAAIVTSIIAALSMYLQRLAKKNQEILNMRYNDRTVELLDEYTRGIEPVDENGRPIVEAGQYLKQIRDYVAHAPVSVSRTDTEVEVNEKIGELKKRLDGIEERFPKEATLEKITSVNDAILGTQIEELSKAIKEIKDRQLTRWDVVAVVFAIITALAATVALISWITTLLQAST